MRQNYAFGIAWIALNDEPRELDPNEVEKLISTLLLADMFGKEPAAVAADIVRVRKQTLAEKVVVTMRTYTRILDRNETDHWEQEDQVFRRAVREGLKSKLGPDCDHVELHDCDGIVLDAFDYDEAADPAP